MGSDTGRDLPALPSDTVELLQSPALVLENSLNPDQIPEDIEPRRRLQMPASEVVLATEHKVAIVR